MGLQAKPEWFPKAFTPIVVLRQTAPEASFFHQTMTADSCKSLGKSLAKFHEDGGFGPYMLQTVYNCMAENEIGYRLTYAAEGIGTIGQNS
jgi:hypothetical protein